ncbi:MAG: hypothetical protein E7491_09765 [Ruminococcaceae bacterium]|nr:hypothetical protein [Oscillospiraceae bacterium]
MTLNEKLSKQLRGYSEEQVNKIAKTALDSIENDASNVQKLLSDKKKMSKITELLSEEDRKKVNEFLSDEKKIEKLIRSGKAEKLLKKFMEE